MARQSSDTLAAAIVGHAKVLYHLNQPYDAMLELEDFLRKEPNSVPALQLFATLHAIVREDNRRAVEIMERCSQLAPKDPGVWQYLGNLYLVMSREEEGVRCLERAVQFAPQDAQVLASLAYAYSKVGKAAEGQARFEQARSLLGHTAQPALIWLTYGKALLEERRWEESRSAYNEALRLDPESSEAHYGRAVANENLKDFAAAAADALASISEYPIPRKDAYLLLIRVSRVQNDQAKAEKYARELARVVAQEMKNKDDSRVLRELLFKAEPLFMQGQYVPAAAAYEELVRRAPQFYEAYFALGMCYAHTSQLAKAEEAFKKYLTLQPLSADGHASLGLVFLETNRMTDARSELERALQIDPGMLEVRASLARIQASASDFSKAVHLLLQAPNPEAEWDEDYYLLVVSCLGAAKRMAEAEKFCAKGTARFPNSERLAKLRASLR
ncbi:MAG: tetratricopeptide repeat protein [Acidobacteria bacterium]|nr:MAG: tetratricopeptide repeat protein [Acidobacteriota bacterium]